MWVVIQLRILHIYKGLNIDGDSTFGYGNNPPAFGIVSLNQEMSAFGTYSGNTLNTLPSSAQDMFYFMNGQWNDGSFWMYGNDGISGTVPTKFMYSGNPNISTSWNEISNGNPFITKKAAIIVNDLSLSSGSNVCYDFAFLFSREIGNDYLQNVNALIAQSTTAKTDFDLMNFNCNQVTLGIEQLDETQIGLHPNPTRGTFTLSFGDQAIDGEISVTDMNGRVLLVEEINHKNVKILDLDTKSGIYFVTIKTGFHTVHKRLIITE